MRPTLSVTVPSFCPPAARAFWRSGSAVLLDAVPSALTGCGDQLGDDFSRTRSTSFATGRTAKSTDRPDIGPDSVADLLAEAEVAADADADADGSPGSVCDLWRSEYPTRATRVWTPGATACDPGTADPTAIEDAVRRTNLFRHLVGLPPMVANPEFSRKAQLCAVLQRGMGGLDHTPPTDAPCYTAEGAEAAGSSNLAWGVGTMADAVDLYVGDEGVPSLGHRRWILHPPYAQGGFGIADTYSCQWVFGSGADPGVPFVAYPGPGDFPQQALMGPWSLSSSSGGFAGAAVTVTRVSDGTAMSVSGTYVADPRYGLDTMAWRVGGTLTPGEYRVQVTGGSRSYDYTTNLVDCR